MAEVLLFHHAQGQTAGFHAFADELRRAGHTVHTPDLFDGRTFASIEEGMALRRGDRLRRDHRARRHARRTSCRTSSSTPASRSACCRAQKLAQTRPARAGALLFYSCVPGREFGDRGRRACRCRSTGWTPTRSSSARATSTPPARWSRRPTSGAVPLSGRPALLRRQQPAVVRRGGGGTADPARARLPRRLMADAPSRARSSRPHTAGRPTTACRGGRR